jgi:hypothetical protein
MQLGGDRLNRPFFAEPKDIVDVPLILRLEAELKPL